MSMPDTKLGQIIHGDVSRDAIHIAIAPIEADEHLEPGEHVGLTNEGKASARRKAIGIVDPFLTAPVKAGERFWLCLYQQTVTGMRHHWSHPAFTDQAALSSTRITSEEWLRAFAAHVEGVGLSYNELMQAAAEYLETGKSYCFGEDIDYSTDWDEFWKHYRNVTGRAGDGEFFRCAC